ncbi:MAG TPA: entericidin A/B family lipoprotein [Acetobacteraceae bacterium]|nr:entericidin A/B family lipoprotein [Acetobacteraceae bacterium]
MRNRKFIRSLSLALLLASAAPILSACNTVAGAGKDVSNTGQAVGQGVQGAGRAVGTGVQDAGQAVTRGANDVRRGM